MPSIRSISQPSFYQKLGKYNLLKYLSDHPLLDKTRQLLEDCKNIDTKLAEQLKNLFYAEDNPKFNEDAENFSDIANLASDNGLIKLEQLYGQFEPIREILNRKDLNNFDISFQLFNKHKNEFDNVLIRTQVERKSNWFFFESKCKCETKELEKLDSLKEQFLSLIEKELNFQNVNLQINTGDNHRWLICLKHPDRLRVKEKYTKNKFKIESERKALEIYLIFIPSDGIIKVHDDQKSQKNTEIVIREFTNVFIENSEEYFRQLKPVSFNLNAFINIRDISDLKNLKDSEKIKHISYESIEFTPTKNSDELIRIKGFNDTSLKSMFKRHSNYSINDAQLKEIKVDFIFTGKGSRNRKLRINNTNGANLKASESRDEIMRQALISWGVINVFS